MNTFSEYTQLAERTMMDFIKVTPEFSILMREELARENVFVTGQDLPSSILGMDIIVSAYKESLTFGMYEFGNYHND